MFTVKTFAVGLFTVKIFAVKADTDGAFGSQNGEL